MLKISGNIVRLCFGAGAFVAFGITSLTFGNSGTLLPLDQYQAGTESVDNTNVKNGRFEQVTAGSPDFWTAGSPIGTGTLAVGSSMQVGAPTGANSSPAINGNFAAQGPGGNTFKRNGFTQTIKFSDLPNQSADGNYILSGYGWNFSNSAYDLVLVEMRDSANYSLSKTWSLAALDIFNLYSTPAIDGSRGVFGLASFNAPAAFPSGEAELQVSFEYDYDNDPNTVRPLSPAQIDNISLTPSGQFALPTAVPEPASLSVLSLATIAMLRRRRA